MSKNGVIFDIQRYSVHDGPGIRTIVFFKGCPLRCLWCQNPEGLSISPQLLFYKNLCTNCGACLSIPDCSAITRDENGIILFNREECVACGRCVDICIHGAREMAGSFMSVQEVIEEIKKDSTYYRRSGGGVTLSGGESLQQIDFCYELLCEMKRSFIHTAIETCGYCPSKNIEKILENVDLFLFDFKHMDPQKHKKFTGVHNSLILENAKYIARKGVEIIARLPIIPTINDDKENLIRTAEFLKENRITTKVDLMPYHRLGVNKYSSAGFDYSIKEVLPHNGEAIEYIRNFFEDFGFETKIEGFVENSNII